MKIGITLKLFLTFFLICMIIIAIMAVSVRFSFQSGFLDYVNRVELERVELLAATFADEYEKYGDWTFIKYKEGIWRRLIVSHLRASKHGEIHSSSLVEKPAEPGLDLTDVGLRLALLDANKDFVAGNRQIGEDAVLKPIITNDELVGWLSITPSNELVETVDIQFKERQNNTIVVITLISIFIAALIAVIVSRQLLNPIKSLANATKYLTAGKFNTRITVTDTDEIGQLQHDFNSLAHTLEYNEHLRRQWIADISHELRTPMAILLGEVEAMLDGIRTPDNSNLVSLQTEIIRLNKLIDDLYQLSMSDIGAIQYHKQQIAITDVLNRVIYTYREQLKSKQIDIKINMQDIAPLHVNADQQRLFQLFANLLQNTVRYTDEGGQCQVSCEWFDNHVIINWEDSAPNVDDKKLNMLFDRLYRVDESRNRQSGGAGLGLSICKKIVEAHDGEITVQHSPLGGLWFKIRFPALERQEVINQPLDAQSL